MKTYLLFFLAIGMSCGLSAQNNVGIGGSATRARLEVFGVAGAGNTSAIFGSDNAGVSFQKNWPSVGFNQYRDGAGGYGKFLDNGYAAVQYMDPATGAWALDMQGNSGLKDAGLQEPYRSFTFFPSGGLSMGKTNNNSAFMVDYLNYNGSNTANGSIYFYGTQYPSYINLGAGVATILGPGKDGGTTFINDLPNTKTVIGGTAGKLGINTNPLYITSLSIRHAQDGAGLLLREETNNNNWEWYVSNDNPVWIGQKYNGALIGDYNPTTGVHGYVSDARLKTAIRPMEPVLHNLLQLQPVEYHMKGEDSGRAATQGFIAQEVAKFYPELVSIITDKQPGYKGLPDLHMLNYSQFFVLAIKAIQEQQAELEAITQEITQLEKQKQ